MGMGTGEKGEGGRRVGGGECEWGISGEMGRK